MSMKSGKGKIHGTLGVVRRKMHGVDEGQDIKCSFDNHHEKMVINPVFLAPSVWERALWTTMKIFISFFPKILTNGNINDMLPVKGELLST